MDRERYHRKFLKKCNICNYCYFLFLIVPFLSTKCFGFQFDGWSSGQQLHSICRQSELNGKELYKDTTGLGGNGVVDLASRVINKPIKCNKLSDITQVSYGRVFFEKPCTVTLYFTPKSKRLMHIAIEWNDLSLENIQARSYDKQYLKKVLKQEFQR